MTLETLQKYSIDAVELFLNSVQFIIENFIEKILLKVELLNKINEKKLYNLIFKLLLTFKKIIIEHSRLFENANTFMKCLSRLYMYKSKTSSSRLLMSIISYVWK